MSRKEPHAFKQNFWSRTRVEKGVTIREVAELIGKGEKQVGMFFSGQLMPNEQAARDICALFDVDYNQGDLEFQAAHRNWKAEHKFSEAILHKKDKKKKVAPEDVCAANKLAEVKCDDTPATLTVDEVRKMFATRWQYAQKALYGKVDCDIYEAIRVLFEVNL